MYLLLYSAEHSLNASTIRTEIEATKDRIRDISYQLEHPPENPNVPIDYDRIRSMISAIEKEQN